MTPQEKERILKIIPELKAYKTINEIADVAKKFLDKYEIIDKDIVSTNDAKEKINYIKQIIEKIDYNDFQNSFKEVLTNDGKKLKEYYPILRIMLIGTQHGIGVHKMVELIGKDWVKNRVKNFNF